MIVAGDPTKSPLFQRITSADEDERMPAKADPLSAGEVALVKAWIEAGAPWPESAADRAAAFDPRLQHWSVQPVRTEFKPTSPGAALCGAGYTVECGFPGRE